MKKIFSLLMAVILCFSLTATAFAAEADPSPVSSDAFIAYEDEHVVVYDTREGASARTYNYEAEWFDSGYNGSIALKIYCDKGSGNISLTVGSNGTGYFFGNVLTPDGKIMSKNDFGLLNVQEVYLRNFQAQSGYYTVKGTIMNSAGFRVMVWIYDA